MPMRSRQSQQVDGAVPTPPLRLGIVCDVSGSMHHLAPAVASTAWILAHAAHHTTTPADTATVIFGHHVRPITRSGTAPAHVAEFTANDNYEDIPTVIDALDGALGLSRPGAARLLVIISDGLFRADPRHEGQQRLDRLRAAGCGVLWLTTDTTDTPLDGATVHLLSDPAPPSRPSDTPPPPPSASPIRPGTGWGDHPHDAHIIRAGGCWRSTAAASRGSDASIDPPQRAADRSCLICCFLPPRGGGR